MSQPRWHRELRLSCRRLHQIPLWWQWASRVTSNRPVFPSVLHQVASWIHVVHRPTRRFQCSRRRHTTEDHGIDRWPRRSDIVDSPASSDHHGWMDYKHQDSQSSRAHLAPRYLITHVTTQREQDHRRRSATMSCTYASATAPLDHLWSTDLSFVSLLLMVLEDF